MKSVLSCEASWPQLWQAVVSAAPAVARQRSLQATDPPSRSASARLAEAAGAASASQHLVQAAALRMMQAPPSGWTTPREHPGEAQGGQNKRS